MRREKLKVVVPPADSGHYIFWTSRLGFSCALRLQRMIVIFAARMIEALTPTQFFALAKLAEVGPCSQNHLGRLIHLDAATIKAVVDRLVARGFVTSLNEPNDRRRRAVALTDRGDMVTQAAAFVAREITEASIATLTDEERRTLAGLLKKIG
jgi:DNA-binding MarR family transcriptional regulator